MPSTILKRNYLKSTRGLLLAGLGIGFAGPALAQIEAGLSVGIQDFAVLPTDPAGPNRMNLMTADPNGRLFVNSQRGPLYTISNDGSSVATYLDLTAQGQTLNTGSGEQGFQSFAFHPDFYNESTAGFGKFYTVHSDSNTAPAPTYAFTSNTGSGIINNNADSVLLEWSVSDPGASTYTAGGGTTPRQVMRIVQPATNHNAGQLAFNTSIDSADADYGNLYFALGDGGSGNDPWNNASSTNNLYGKILRINPLDPDAAGSATYSVPDNAFATDGDSATLGEIYAYGLRNPQRFGWDDATGTLYAADIGQGSAEEINAIVNGGFYGWDLVEGTGGTATGDILPIAHYNHGGDLPNATIGNRAITMGEVVRGTGIPGLDGLLLAGDFPNGVPLYIDLNSGDPAEGSGVGPFAELILVDPSTGDEVKLIDLIDANRLDGSSRADLRYSFGTDGRVFVLNKHDNIIRELVPVPEPGSLALLGGMGLLLTFRRRR